MRRGFNRGFGGGKAAPALRRAYELLEAGDYPAAAQAFQELASAAERRGGPRAPMLHVQAGRAFMQAGDTGQALVHLKKGLEMLAARGKWARFQRVGQRAEAFLRQKGLDDQARELNGYLQKSLPPGFNPSMAPSLRRRPLLPARCPSCGAAVESDEVEWIDEMTAECDYCGSPIRAQEKAA